jgi:hypothetical protein
MAQSFEYYNYINDDSDGDSIIEYEEGDVDNDGYLDTKWISTCEEQLLLDEYNLFLKSDIVRVSFQFVYLNRDKSGVDSVVRMNESYILQTANQITQNEIFGIIHKFQYKGKKKYYNFKSLLLYDFQMPDNNENDVKWLSEYLYSSSAYDSNEYGRIIEYTNLLSFNTICFRPLITMFHDLIGFTVVLYED